MINKLLSTCACHTMALTITIVRLHFLGTDVSSVTCSSRLDLGRAVLLLAQDHPLHVLNERLLAGGAAHAHLQSEQQFDELIYICHQRVLVSLLKIFA